VSTNDGFLIINGLLGRHISSTAYVAARGGDTEAMQSIIDDMTSQGFVEIFQIAADNDDEMNEILVGMMRGMHAAGYDFPWTAFKQDLIYNLYLFFRNSTEAVQCRLVAV
jgi:hypothetical protein